MTAASGALAAAVPARGAAATGPSLIERLDARAKLLGLLAVTVAAVSAGVGQWPVWGACAAVLVTIAAVGRVAPRAVWRRVRIVLPPVLLVAAVVPVAASGEVVLELGPLDVTREGLETCAATSAKAVIGTLAAVLLGATTPFPAVLRALESLRVPRTLTLIAACMYRYLFVIAAEAQRMRTARDARGYRGRGLREARVVGRLLTALFLRSYARGERVHAAMLARGFSGSVPALAPPAFAVRDATFVAAVLAVLLPVRVLA